MNGNRLTVKTWQALTVVVMWWSLALAQQASNLVKPRMAGVAVASQFGEWTVMADGPITGSGQPEAVSLRTAAFTLRW